MGSLKRRTIQLLSEIPDCLIYDSLLYVGASKKRTQMLDLFYGAGYHVTILEAWEPNVKALESLDWRPPVRIIQGDVRNLKTLNLGQFDVTMFWHGPEHLPHRHIARVAQTLHTSSRVMSIMACPPEFYKQGEAQGNPYEKHISSPDKDFFTELGWHTNIESNNLLVWRRQNDIRYKR